MNNDYSAIAKNYKRKIAGGFMLVDGAKLNEKIGGEDFLVTKKLDGEMQILFYEKGKVQALGSHGKEQTATLTCLEEFGELCKSAGLKSAVIAAELYAKISVDGRERVGDVKAAIAAEQYDKLFLAPFDIIDLNGEEYKAEHYKTTHAKLVELFTGTQVKPVEGKVAKEKAQVEQIYNDWCVDGGAEGLVVHCELPFVYKIKPRHTLDCVIIGYTVGEDVHAGMIRDIMVAAMNPEGQLLQFTTLGNGFSDAQRTEMLARLSQMHVESEYVETDSRNVAYQMVRPEIVVEISVIDLVSENSKGEAKMDMLLSYTDEEGYKVVAQAPGVSAHSPVFERLRDDKSCNTTDIRISQLTDLCPFSEGKSISLNGLPKSELLVRRIFTKGADAKLMIQKYVIWKTNKEDSGAFPAYVLHYTDFSVSRKEPLKRDIRVSNDKDQIFKLMDEFIADNVKKGWAEKVADQDASV